MGWYQKTSPELVGEYFFINGSTPGTTMVYIRGCKPVICVTLLKISVTNIYPKRRDTIAIIVIYRVCKNSCDLILSQYCAAAI
jgi:hypothetical protein